MYTMTAQIIGAKELAEAFRRAPEMVKKELYNAVYDGMRDLQNTARNTAPHKTGRLQASIDSEGPRVSGDNVTATVGTNVEYARVQELGCGPFIIVPVRRKVLADKKRGIIFGKIVHHPGIKAKLYFKKSIEETRPRFTDFMQKALTRIVTYLAEK